MDRRRHPVGYRRFADDEATFGSRPVTSFEETGLSLTADSQAAKFDGDVAERDCRPGRPETDAVVREGERVRRPVPSLVR